MSKLISYGYKKLAGFSLLELMVVVAILGVLATVAVPRFNIFRARARQSEVKSNLGVIFTLQEAFAIDHERYYNGNGTYWSGAATSDMKNLTTADGYAVKAGSAGCVPLNIVNKLGFRLANCAKARYGYYIAEAVTDETNFLAVGYAPSDDSAGKRIFPGCDGNVITRPASDPTTSLGGVSPCSLTDSTAASTAFSGEGDAWCMDHGRNLHNYWDVVAGCDQ